jgi:hypothetical protein
VLRSEEWRKLPNGELHNSTAHKNLVWRSNEVGIDGHSMWLVMVEGRSVHVFLVGKPDSKRGLGD